MLYECTVCCTRQHALVILNGLVGSTPWCPTPCLLPQYNMRQVTELGGLILSNAELSSGTLRSIAGACVLYLYVAG